ncbi:MAG: hypothetical protein QOI61_1153 [Actinomycetota bacterium]|jgi:catechol 2,3-dioxygenase-like lactoylglutathione lyase family enzyme
MRTKRLTHVAMGVPRGTLTDDYRRAVLDFYGELFGWREITELSNEERMTIATGGGSYVNVREHDGAVPMEYEHFGVEVSSLDEVHAVAAQARAAGVEPDPLGEPILGVVTLRIRHLLPMAIEVQNLPQ